MRIVLEGNLEMPLSFRVAQVAIVPSLLPTPSSGQRRTRRPPGPLPAFSGEEGTQSRGAEAQGPQRPRRCIDQARSPRNGGRPRVGAPGSVLARARCSEQLEAHHLAVIALELFPTHRNLLAEVGDAVFDQPLGEVGQLAPLTDRFWRTRVCAKAMPAVRAPWISPNVSIEHQHQRPRSGGACGKPVTESPGRAPPPGTVRLIQGRRGSREPRGPSASAPIKSAKPRRSRL